MAGNNNDAGAESHVNDDSSGLGQGSDAVGGDRNGMDNAKEKIEEFDWEGLEGRFWGRMEEFRKVEEGAMREFGELVQVCGVLFLFFVP